MARPTPIEGLDRDTDRRTGLRRLITGRLEDLLLLLPKFDEGAEAVHDARVASRRVRAALSLFPFDPPGARRQAAAEVALLGRALGRVRDADVAIAWLEGVAEGAGGPDAGEAPGVAAQVRRLRAEREAAFRALSGRVRAFLGGGVHRVREALSLLDARGRLGGGGVRRRLARRAAQARRLLRPALSGRADDLHLLRIAVKKLRYHAELLEDVVPRAEALCEILPPLQELLGAVHDHDHRLVWLPREAARAPREELPGIAWLLRRTYAEREQCLVALLPALLRFLREDLFRARQGSMT